jgi:2'-5' RNA ligase
MPNTKRLFIAAPVPPGLKEVFRQHQAALTQPAVRFLPDENLHLTVHFLGEVPADQVLEIQLSINIRMPRTGT